MYRLLIVDDEKYIVDGMYQYLVKSAKDKLDIYKAYSSSQAAALLKKNHFDIVLADIQMPGLTGVDLLNLINQYRPSCKVIFLTGYKKFEYVLTAMKKGVVDYVLKINGNEAVLSAINEAIRQIEDDMKKDKLIKNVDNASAIHREYLLNIINGIISPDTESFQKLDILLDPEKPVILLMGIITNKINDLYIHTKTGHSLTETLKQVLGDKIASVFADIDIRNYLWLLQPAGPLYSIDGNPYDRLATYVNDLLGKLSQFCYEAYGYELMFVLDGEMVKWANIKKEYDVLVKKSMPYAWNHSSFIIKKDSNKQADNEKVEHANGSLINPKLKIMEIYLENANYNKFVEIFDELTYPLNFADLYNPDAIELYTNIALTMLSFINQYHLYDNIKLKNLFSIDDYECWHDALSYLKSIAKQIHQIMKQNAAQDTDNILHILKEYVDSHLSEELTLVELSEMLHFNPNYFSRLFKKLTGKTIKKFIIDLRMEKAKSLLDETDLQIQQIAQIVGYNSASYFSNSFKKEFLVSPLEYRQN